MMEIRRPSLLLLFCLILLPLSVEAAVRRICLVSYETKTGWSEKHKTEVAFMSGYELNESELLHGRDPSKYDFFASYALIWFDNDEVAILKIESMMIRRSFEFDNRDFRNLFLVSEDVACDQVNGQGKRRWKISGRDLAGFFDRRAER